MANNRELSQFANTVGYNGGSIGINSASPREKLDVKDGRIILDQDYQFTWANGTTNRARIYGDSGDNFIVETGSSNTERLRIASDGKLTATRTSTTAYDSADTTNDSGFLLLNHGAAGHATLQFQSLSSGTAQTGQATISSFNETAGSKNTALTFGTRQASDATIRERLRIASDGQATFDKGAPGSANQVIARFQAESSRRLDVVWHDSGSLMGFDTPSNHSYIFKTNGTERLRITSGGSVGFNTTLTQSSKTVHIAGDYRTSTQNVADEGLIFQSFATATTGDVYPGISWTGNPGALGRARAAITAIATNNNNGSDLVFLTRNQADGTELDVTDDEKLRINSNSQLLHTRTDDTTRYDLEFRNTGGISDGNYGGIHWSQGSTGSTNLAAIEIEYADNGRPDMVFKTRQSSGTSMSEAARIDSLGRFRTANQPAFSVRRNSSQDIPHQTVTKVQWNTEIFDVGGNFDSSTNFRFTAPVAGKYLFLGHLYIYSTYQVEARIYKNGSIYKRFSGPLGTGGNDNPNGMDFMDIVDLSENDFIEIFGYHARTGDSNTISIYGGNLKETSFVGYLLG